jgi:2-polyprenyl-3-methyl-5-hydroxy-6-metoxy-1,4-benzoquinol methylase
MILTINVFLFYYFTNWEKSMSQDISSKVQKLYDTYPFPPEPLLDAPPPGYNWRWQWEAAYNFCANRKPETSKIRILDAGCGTGVGTEYLVHLNPHAEITAIDLSSGALNVAKERCQRSGANRVNFHHLSIYDVAQIEGEFDFINSVGVLHHLPDPIKGIKALSSKLKPGGLMHIFVYGELGRREIQLMQKAIALLQGDQRGDYTDGVKIGRKIFASLPENNRLVQREKQLWSLENHRDECFADMYVHPQEIDYNIDTLFELINASGLDFVGFSNPQTWNLQRLIGQDQELIERANQLTEQEKYRLIELLDPEPITHYEFFLSAPDFHVYDWSQDDILLNAICDRNPCMDGWESKSLFNYNYEVVNLTDDEFKFLQICDRNSEQKQPLSEILTQVNLDLETVRSLLTKQLIMLTPA